MLCPIPHGFARRRSERTRCADKLVRLISLSRPDRAAHASLLNDVRSQPIGKAARDGCLFN